MKKLISSLVAVLFLVTVAAAAPAKQQLPLLSPDGDSVVSLGSAIDPKTKLRVDGMAIIHRKANFSHRPNHGSGGATTCYGFLAKGAKWKSVEPWVMNPANSDSLDTSFAFNNLAGDIAKWEAAASANILGNGTSTTDTLVADTASPDDKNEVYFADVADPGVIAVTIVWGVFGGPTFNRQLVEWDQVYDDVDHDWSATGEPGKMDFENIATHELGHSVGMADLYTLACSEQTMYGYADNGENKKRTLESGDITGINALY